MLELRPADVEGPIRSKLEDWEDALTSATKAVIEQQVQTVTAPTDGKEFISAIGLLNGAKSAGETFTKVTGLGASAVAPQFAIPLTVMTKVAEVMRLDGGQAQRVKLIERDYGAVLDDFLAQVRLAEDIFPSSEHGKELARRVAGVASHLRFENVAIRNTWCMRFLENSGAIEVRENVLKEVITEGFKPIFEKLGMVIKGSLRSDVGKIPRWLGADPNWKWSGFDIHVPGTHRGRPGEWPGSVQSGFRRASSDEVRDIVTNFWRYKISPRSFLVGAAGYASMHRVVECTPVPNATKSLPVPDISGALDWIFQPLHVTSVLHMTSQQIPDGVFESNLVTPSLH